MFFENQHFYNFVEECRRQGITVPIIPGLKLITAKGQLTSIPKTFHCDIPQPLADEVLAAEPEDVREIGIEWALEQTEDLLGNGQSSVHFYVMGNSGGVSKLLGKLDI